jgi:exodeoxyribonuclease VII small subunit
MPAKPTYRELQDKLDDVLAELQAEDVDIDMALAKYQEGLKLVEQLEARLKTAQNSVRELKKSAE